MAGTIVLGAIAFVLMIVVVVGIHELGHFATAKWSGIRVDEFAIGFGPRLWSRRRGETVYSLRALPLGGFVKMPGMSALEDDDGGPRGFIHASVGRQVIVLVAGVTMNFLLYGVLSGVLLTRGVGSVVVPNSAASVAGLRSGDTITAVAGHTVDSGSYDSAVNAVRSATTTSRGAPVPVTYTDAAGATHSTTLQPVLVLINADDSQPLTDSGGVAVGEVVVDSVAGRPLGTGDAAALLAGSVAITGHAYGSAPGDASARVTATIHGVVPGTDPQIGALVASWKVGYGPERPGAALPVALFHGFVNIPGDVASHVRDIWNVLFTPNSGGVKNFQGPVGIAVDASDAAQAGIWSYLNLVALISLSLGIINLLPIPPFDGGRVVLSLRQAVMRGSGARTEMVLIAAGALLIGSLALFITFNDIKGL